MKIDKQISLIKQKYIRIFELLDNISFEGCLILIQMEKDEIEKYGR